MTLPSIALLLAMAGIFPEHTVTGRVLDDASGQPVSGAFVAVSWSARGADMVGSRTSCSDLQVTKTDDKGEFLVHGRHPPSGATVKVFKAGLETRKRDVDKNERWEVRMMPLASSIEDRKREYGYIWVMISCGETRQAREKLRPIGEEIDKELLVLDPSRPPYFVRRLNEMGQRPQ